MDSTSYVETIFPKTSSMWGRGPSQYHAVLCNVIVKMARRTTLTA